MRLKKILEIYRWDIVGEDGTEKQTERSSQWKWDKKRRLWHHRRWRRLFLCRGVQKARSLPNLTHHILALLYVYHGVTPLYLDKSYQYIVLMLLEGKKKDIVAEWFSLLYLKWRAGDNTQNFPG